MRFAAGGTPKSYGIGAAIVGTAACKFVNGGGGHGAARPPCAGTVILKICFDLWEIPLELTVEQRN
jgi:hypothetical protein